MKFIRDVALQGKKVLMRLDLNVPIKDGKILDDTRITASLPTIRLALQQGENRGANAGGNAEGSTAAKIILMSHLGRPDSSKPAAEQPQFSLAPVAARLSELLNLKIEHVSIEAAPAALANNDIVMLENTRFWQGETDNDSQLAQSLAQLCDVFVMDAFGSAHRAHASTEGVARYAPLSCAGLLLQKEIEALNKALDNPPHPVLAVVGGAKVGEKLRLLDKLANVADVLIVGGGIANTFLAATGKAVGNSLYEADLQLMAQGIIDKTQVLLPVDVVVAEGLDSPSGKDVLVDEVMPQDMILDVGKRTMSAYAEAINAAKTIIWNGPLGVFEKEPFAAGTQSLVHSISNSPAYSLAGGGETLAAISRFSQGDGIDYISTGGGAFLEYIEKGTLPGIAVLDDA